MSIVVVAVVMALVGSGWMLSCFGGFGGSKDRDLRAPSSCGFHFELVFGCERRQRPAGSELWLGWVAHSAPWPPRWEDGDA